MSAFEAFDAAATELMLEQKVKASELHERLRNITKNASKDLPPLEVLYCDSYGGYNYSKEFEGFLETVKTVPDSLATICALQFGPEQDNFGNFLCYSHKNRVRHVQWLAPFGQDVMDKWPGIVPLVQAYMKHDLGKEVELIQKILSTKKHLHKILEISEGIGAQVGTIDGRTEYSIHAFEAQHDFSGYAPSVLGEILEKCDDIKNKLTLAIEEYHELVRLELTEAQISAMVKNVEEKDEDEDWRELQRRSKFSFIERLARYGEDHHAVWEKQSIFNTEAMRFLCSHPEHTKQLASEGNYVNCAKKVGLCAAGGDSCNLNLAEVPRVAEWMVREYDGLETVQLV